MINITNDDAYNALKKAYGDRFHVSNIKNVVPNYYWTATIESQFINKTEVFARFDSKSGWFVDEKKQVV